jgi:hypothetical protein
MDGWELNSKELRWLWLKVCNFGGIVLLKAFMLGKGGPCSLSVTP